MSTATVPQTTDNRQKFNAAIAEASAPAPYGSERWQRAFDRLKALRTHVKTLTPEEAGIAYNNHFGPEVAVWDDKAPAWAKVGESSRAVSVLPNGDPMTIWSSENLIGFDEVDAFIIRSDVYEVDTDTIDVGNVYLRVYIGRHDPIDLTSPAEARMVHAALGDSARRFEEVLGADSGSVGEKVAPSLWGRPGGGEGTYRQGPIVESPSAEGVAKSDLYWDIESGFRADLSFRGDDNLRSGGQITNLSLADLRALVSVAQQALVSYDALPEVIA